MNGISSLLFADMYTTIIDQIDLYSEHNSPMTPWFVVKPIVLDSTARTDTC